MNCEAAQRKYSDVEGRSLRTAQEKEMLANELKVQREAHMLELENLRTSGDFLRKSVGDMRNKIDNATADSYRIKFDFEEMMSNLDGFKRELRRISENIALKSKEKNRFKNMHEEVSLKESDLNNKNLSMQMEILELTTICKQYESENRVLKSQVANTREVFGNTLYGKLNPHLKTAKFIVKTLDRLNSYLSARADAPSLLKETEAQNAQLQQQNHQLSTQLAQVENELAACRQALKSSSSAYQQSKDALDSQLSSVRNYKDLLQSTEASLSSLLSEQQQAISEASKQISPSHIHELQSRIACLSESLGAAVAKTEHLEEENRSLKLALSSFGGNTGQTGGVRVGGHVEHEQPARGLGQSQESKSKSLRRVLDVRVAVPPSLGPTRDTRAPLAKGGLPQPASSALLSTLRHKVDRKAGKKFCNRCGTLIKPKDKYLECSGCEAAVHPKCLSAEVQPLGGGEFHCEECL